MLEILNGHVSGTVILPSRRAPDAGIDEATDAVVVKCLAKRPEDRFASTDDFADALRGCVSDRAFLRDAARLPGIQDAGLELSSTSPAGRRISRQEAEGLSEGRLADGPSGEPMGDLGGGGPLGDDEVANRDELASLGHVLDDVPGDARDHRPSSKGFRETTRLRGRGRRRVPWSVIAVVFLAAGSLTFWRLSMRDSAKVPPTTARAAGVLPAISPQPSAPSVPAAKVVAVPLPVAAPAAVAGPALVATPSSSVGKEAGKPRHAGEIGRHLPVALPSANLPSAGAMPAETPPQPEPVISAIPTAGAPAELPEATTASAPAPAAPTAAAAGHDALLHEAQQAWLRQHYAMAIDKARSALDLSPDDRLAYQIIAVCSCALHNADDANQALAHLELGKRKLVRSLCEKNGVVLDAE
jgi:hypothetical protein